MLSVVAGYEAEDLVPRDMRLGVCPTLDERTLILAGLLKDLIELTEMYYYEAGRLYARDFKKNLPWAANAVDF